MIHLQLQIFLLLLIGYFLGKKGWITPATRGQLTNIVVQVILPASIISSFQMSLSSDLLRTTGMVLIAAVGMQFIYGILNMFLYRFLPEDEQVGCKYGTMVTNASFVGLPIISSMYGQTGLLYASIFAIPQRIFMWTYGLPLYSSVDKKSIVKKILTHPCIISILIGFIVMAFETNGYPLPQFISKTISSLSGCTTALCMLIIGSVLSEIPLKEIFDLHAIYYSICRLLIVPALMILILRLTPLDTLGVEVCVMMSAMPAPTSVVILAEQYGKNPSFASKLMVTSTILSLVTIPIVSSVLGML